MFLDDFPVNTVTGILFDFSVGINNYNGAQIIKALDNYIEFSFSWRFDEAKEVYHVKLYNVKTIEAESGNILPSKFNSINYLFEASRDGAYLGLSNIEEISYCYVDSMEQIGHDIRNSASEERLNIEISKNLNESILKSIEFQVKSIWRGFASYWYPEEEDLKEMKVTESKMTDNDKEYQCRNFNLGCGEGFLKDSIELNLKNMEPMIEEFLSDDEENGFVHGDFLQHLKVSRCHWSSQKECLISLTTSEPHMSTIKKETRIEFNIDNETQFQVAYQVERFLFSWQNNEIIDCDQRLVDFYDECEALYDKYEAIYPTVSRVTELQLMDAFKTYDSDNNGFIDSSELKLIIEELQGKSVTVECLDSIMNDLDLDGDRKIDWTEFRSFFLKQISKSNNIKKLSGFNILERARKLHISAYLGKYAKRKLGKSFKTFWFVLNRFEATLEYYKKKTDLTPRNVFFIYKYRKAIDLNKKEFKFQISGNGEEPDIILEAQNMKDKDMWISEINCVINRQSRTCNELAVCYGHFISAAVANITGLSAIAC